MPDYSGQRGRVFSVLGNNYALLPNESGDWLHESGDRFDLVQTSRLSNGNLVTSTGTTTGSAIDLVTAESSLPSQASGDPQSDAHVVTFAGEIARLQRCEYSPS